MQKGGQGASIRYAVNDSPLGRMLVARTAAGLCAVAFGDRDDELFEELRGRYPAAAISLAGDHLPAETAYLLDQLSPEPSAAHAAPALDIPGTPFQQSVWAAMDEVRRGETMEYGELAAKLGVPNGARAVGAALGQNPLAVVIPCHRFIARGGRLHAFRWGLERKRRLLAIEGARVGEAASMPSETQGELCFGELDHG